MTKLAVIALYTFLSRTNLATIILRKESGILIRELCHKRKPVQSSPNYVGGEDTMTKPQFTLVALEDMTSFAPLAALGHYVYENDLLSPIFSRLHFTPPTHTRHPVAALIDLWVSILAGCRSVWQINTKIRPDLTLAGAWKRSRFAEQSTIARILDACQPTQVNQMREAVAALYRWIGQAPRHDPTNSPLMIDIDLTGMLAGRQAEGSQKGYFSGKKGRAAGNFAG